MSCKTKNNRATKSFVYNRVLTAIAAHLTASVVLGGKSLTPAAMGAVFQATLQARADLDAARAQIALKLQAKLGAITDADQLLRLLKKYLEATYGADSPLFQDFALTPPKTPVVPTAVRAESADKAKATRARKKAAVQSAVAAPATAPATPAPAAATASPAAGAPAKS